MLFDTFAQVQAYGIDLEDFVRDSGAKVVIYSWNLEPKLIEQAMTGGAIGYLSKVLAGPEIVAALERVMRGETVILTGDSETSVDGAGDWPGRSEGLSPREAEILALITQCLSNREIADRAYLSNNTVKTYIRTAYRKIDVPRARKLLSGASTTASSPTPCAPSTRPSYYGGPVRPPILARPARRASTGRGGADASAPTSPEGVPVSVLSPNVRACPSRSST